MIRARPRVSRPAAPPQLRQAANVYAFPDRFRADRPGERTARIRVHAADCPCCRPKPGPADDVALSTTEIAAWCLAGVVLGLMLATLIDWALGGPGVTAMFGAWS